MRSHIGERVKFNGHPPFCEIVQILRTTHYASVNDAMIGGGLITLERAQVIMYCAGDRRAE